MVRCFNDAPRHAAGRSEEEADDLSTRVLATSLLVVHDAIGRSEDDVTKLTRRQQVAGKLLDTIQAHVKAGRDDAALVDAAHEVNNHLPSAMIVYYLEIANVPVLLHHLEELDNHL